MDLLISGSYLTGTWSHYRGQLFDTNQGSWQSDTDPNARGFWRTTTNWSHNSLGSASLYLDADLDGGWGTDDPYIGYAQGYWHGTYSGGTWNRLEGLKSGYVEGSAFGQFHISVEMSFEAPMQGASIAGTTLPELIALNDGPDEVYGDSGNDDIRGRRGGDTLAGGMGNDTIRAGNGRDILSGGEGEDSLYGGFGLNTFEDADDGEIDQLFFKSDQHAYNWIYDKDGNSPNGEKADKIMELDPFDEIFVQGVETEELDFGNVVHYSNLGETLDGIGIYASGTLEAVYVGDDLSLGQIEEMTQGIL